MYSLIQHIFFSTRTVIVSLIAKKNIFATLVRLIHLYGKGRPVIYIFIFAKARASFLSLLEFAPF